MICQIALLFSLFFFHNTIAIPVPDIAAHDCPEAIYKVTEAINVAGKTFLSGDSCKNNYKAGMLSLYCSCSIQKSETSI